MSGPKTTLAIAVVGHTNTGKTSLLRTLTRDVTFGEVSDRPATTRHVEGAAVLVRGRPALELYDTPGLEDSIGLLDALDAMGGARGERLETVRRFLEGPEASGRGRFVQEAKALRQVLKSDMALYVVDARDRVLAKHRDELEILARCATPVVPVLNFTVAPEAQVSAWREHLSRAGMHAVAEFDTVVFDEASERRLYEKMQTLLDKHRAVFDALIQERRRQRERLIDASAAVVADLLLDVAAWTLPVPLDQGAPDARKLEELRRVIRDREGRCVEQLLELHRFRPGDADAGGDLAAFDGRFGVDLFAPEALKQFGVSTGSGAAAGLAVGIALDVAHLGASLGAYTAAGAAIGGLLGGGRTYGRSLLRRARGKTELRCDDATLRLLAVRQTLLVQALLRRGHAAMTPVKPAAGGIAAALRSAAALRLPAPLRQARVRPGWSRLGGEAVRVDSPGRQAAQDELATSLAAEIREKVSG